MTEQWIEIPKTNGYVVSNDGKVKSPDQKWALGRERQLKTFKGRTLIHRLLHGYPTVSIRIGDKRKHLSVHRLVAQAFLPNPNNYRCVNHKDGNKQNNHVDNLEWCTHAGNLLHAYKTGLQPRGSKKFSAKLDEFQVLVIKTLFNDLSLVQIAKYFKVSEKTIEAIKNNRKWVHINTMEDVKLAA
jgi:hypothetical protein